MREKGEEIVQFLVNGGHIKIEQNTSQIEEFKELVKSCCFSENIKMDIIEISPFEKYTYFSYNLEERKIENSTTPSPFECGIILNWDEVKCLILNKKDFCKKGEQNMFKILELYKMKEMDLIIEKHEEMRKSIIEIDEIQSIIKEMENQVKAIAGEEADAYSFDYRGLYEDRTKKALKEIDIAENNTIIELNKKIEQIQALLELAPNYEEKIKILRDYEIMDRKKNIIL